MQKLSTTEIDKAFRESGLNDKQINEASTSFLSSYGNHPTKEALESFIEGYLFNLRMIGMIADNAIVEAEATKEVDKTSNEGWYVYMVSHDEVMASYTDGAFRDYAGYKCINNFDGVGFDEWNNYMPKRGAQQKLIDFMMGEADKEFGGKVPASRTVKKHVKEMLENDIPLMKVEKYNGKVYYKFRNCIDGKYFVRIPYEQLRDLVICTNGKMIKLYVMVCAILQNNDCGTTKHHKITRDHLAKKLGLNSNNRQLLGEIGQMLNGLCRLGFLECLETIETSKDGNTYKIIHSYRKLSLEEYREASKRGTKTITK